MRRRRSRVAIRVESEAGYREGAPAWRMIEVEPKGSKVGSLLDDLPEPPELELRPTRWGLRVSAPFSMLLQRRGRDRPVLVDRPVRLRPGDVLRGGSVSVSPLDAASERALAVGALRLPQIAPEVMADGQGTRPRQETVYDRLGKLRASRDRIAALAIAALAGVGSVVVGYRMVHPSIRDDRVLVHLEGMSSSDAMDARRAVDATLRASGLEPIFHGTLDAPPPACRGAHGVDCARALSAANVLELRLSRAPIAGSSWTLSGQIAPVNRRGPLPPRRVSVAPTTRGDTRLSVFHRGLDLLAPLLTEDLRQGVSGPGLGTARSAGGLSTF